MSNFLLFQPSGSGSGSGISLAFFDWTNYVPGSTGAGSLAYTNFYYMQLANSLWVSGYLVTGTVAATELRFNFPTGYTAPASYVTLSCVGFGTVDSSSVSKTVLIEPNVNYFTFGTASSSAGLAKQTGSALLPSGARFSFFANIRLV